MTSKKRNRKVISTPISKEEYEELGKIVQEQEVTLSMFLKRAVTAYCHSLGYDHLDLTEDIGSWGGKRPGSGRPSEKDS
jgi:hypothetical protein